MNRLSLHLRLVAAGAAAVLVALALAAFGLSWLFNAHVERRAVVELSAQLDQVLAGVDRDATGNLALVHPPTDPRFLTPFDGLYWQIDGPATKLRSRSLWDYSLPLPEDAPIDGSVHVHTIAGPAGQSVLALERKVILPSRLGGGPLLIAVAMDRADLKEAGEAFVADMVPFLGLLAASLILAGWIQVAVGLRPLATVGARVAAVRSGETNRLGSDFPVEVRPLAGEVDALIEAREADITRARARAGDLAHGLKTPLQALYGEAGRLRQTGAGEAAQAIEAIADAMHRHVDRELARARIAARGATASCDVGEAVARVVSVVARTPDGQRASWVNAIGAGVWARIDGDDLTEALGALIENAARHARTGVRISAEAEGAMVSVVVEDDGAGIPPDRIAGLLARGARLDQTGPGTGLGLSIASEIAEAAGGTLTLSNLPSGLAARLTLPAAHPPG